MIINRQSIEMDDQYEKIISAINVGRNILFIGAGGCSKTWTLRKIAQHYHTTKRIACTATTGIAALGLVQSDLLISASTLHRWGGVGLAQGSYKQILSRVRTRKSALMRWKKTEILIIDEISMFGCKLFDLFDQLGRDIRNVEMPFGGIQLILSGDFLQLPPVKEPWLFLSDRWTELNLMTFVFEIPKRYDDLDYFNMLLRIRKGVHTDDDVQSLYHRMKCYHRLSEILEQQDPTKTIKPTILFSKRLDVAAYNQAELDELPTPEIVFQATDTFEPKRRSFDKDYYLPILDDAIPDTISLKVGAQVLLKYNLDVDMGLVNGSRGIIVELNHEQAVVRFINKKVVTISRVTWEVQDKHGKAIRSQIPLVLSWAMTIHKSQSTTIDYCVVDLGGSIFCKGQAYVALSRVRNFRGLFISQFLPKSIMVSKKALAYTSTIISS
jgi:ATP-dependent DNA helicase PIF1